MTVPKWLIPAISVVAAVAIAVAGLFIGARFAATETVPVAGSKISAPVLGTVDPASDLKADLGKDGTVTGSSVLGQRLVTDPDSVSADAVPSDLRDALAAMAASDDPGSDPAALAAAAGVSDIGSGGSGSGGAGSAGSDSGGSASGDPCSPADGSTPPADCPDGLHSVILHSIHLPDFFVSDGTSALCTHSYGNSFVQFDVMTDAPATTALTWQQDDGVVHTMNLATTDADNAAWQSTLATADSIGPWIYLHVCVTLDHLTPSHPVRVTLHSTDFQGRTATTDHVHFPTDTRDRPPTEITPVGNSTVFVSAPMTATDEVRIRAIPVTPGQTPNCDVAPELTGTFQVIQSEETHAVSAASLEASGYLPQFTRRTSIAFAIPAATQVLVCVRWYNTTRSPVWDADTPYFRSEAMLASPDLDVPDVTIDGIVFNTTVPAHSITLSATTEGGSYCGEWTGPDTSGSSINLGAGFDLCNLGSLLGRADANGALNITTRVQTSAGLAVNPHMLPIALEPCASCVGRSQTFDVPLSSFIRPTGLCSGTCPGDTGQAVGVARVTATWRPHVGSGDAGWHVGERVEGNYTTPAPDFPRMDTSAAVVLGAVDAANRSQSASFRLSTDRPVTYSVALNDGACLRPGGSAVVSSTTPATVANVQLTGLCVGTGYNLTITLTAADGTTSVYTPVGRSDHLWFGGEFFTPAVTQAMHESLSITKAGAPLTYVSDLRLYFSGVRARLAVQPGRQCFDGAITPATTAEGPQVGEVIPLEVYMAYALGSQPNTANRYPDGSLECTPAGALAGGPFAHFYGSVTIEQILAGATVTITDPATGYTATLVLHNG